MSQISAVRKWTSYLLSGVVVLFMLFDGVFKFVKPPEVIQGTMELGYSEHHLVVMGTLGILTTLLYIIPSTSILGAVLMTAYFGGAVATHVRLDNPLFTHILFTVYLGVFAWGGLWLRNERLRELFPFVTAAAKLS